MRGNRVFLYRRKLKSDRLKLRDCEENSTIYNEIYEVLPTLIYCITLNMCFSCDFNLSSS